MRLDLAQTTPTLLPGILREAARDALDLAADPLNRLDDNPFIRREWIALSAALHAAAIDLEDRLMRVFCAAPIVHPAA